MKTILPVVAIVFSLCSSAHAGLSAFEVTPEWEDQLRERAPDKAPAPPAQKRKVLVFSLATGYKHWCIPHTEAMVRILGEKSGAYEITATRDIEQFRVENLAQYDAVVMNNTCPDRKDRDGFRDVLINKVNQFGAKYKDLPAEEREALATSLYRNLVEYVSGGGGLVLLHGGITSFNHSDEFSGVAGGSFDFHPPQQDVTLKLVDPAHPLLKPFGGKPFTHHDEPYLFNRAYPKLNFHPLLEMDMSKLKSDKRVSKLPELPRYVSWIKRHEQGRVFFCSPSHNAQSFEQPELLAFILGGIQYALGDLDCDDQPLHLVSRKDQAPPNIVWIFSDDHATQAIGAYGGRFEQENLTPHIDSLAKDGMLFERAYVGNSICAPSRATLLTGKHSHLHGKIDNRGGFNHNQQQFQKILQQHGYQTAMIGKIHLAGKMQGFDYWEVLPGQGKYWDPEFITEEGRTHYPKQHSTDVITERALNWLKTGRDEEKPFMLMVHYKAPHRAWNPTKRWKEKFKHRNWPEPDNLFDNYEGRGTAAHKQDMSISKTMRMERDVKSNQPERRKELEQIDPNDAAALTRLKYQWYMRDYLACIAGVDENIGKLLRYLEENGLDKNTVVMYSSDQGFYLGEHGWFDKRFMYEESFRTPLVARWPGVIKPGSRNDDLVQNIDFAETFLDIAGVSAPADMQGESLVPLMKGKTPKDWRTSLYYHYYEYPAVHSVRRHEGVADKRFKLIRFYGKDVPDGEEWELYDLEKDPLEMKSQYSNSEYEEVVAIMKQELKRLKKVYEVPTTK